MFPHGSSDWAAGQGRVSELERWVPCGALGIVRPHLSLELNLGAGFRGCWQSFVHFKPLDFLAAGSWEDPVTFAVSWLQIFPTSLSTARFISNVVHMSVTVESYNVRTYFKMKALISPQPRPTSTQKSAVRGRGGVHSWLPFHFLICLPPLPMLLSPGLWILPVG